MIDRQPNMPDVSDPTPLTASIVLLKGTEGASLSPDDPLFTPERASEYLGGISTKTLEAYRAKGIGPQAIKLARRIFYRRSALDAYLVEMNAALIPGDPLLTPEQASEYFGGAASPKTLEYYRAKGCGPAFTKVSRRVFYRRSALDAFLDSLASAAPKGARRRGKAA